MTGSAIALGVAIIAVIGGALVGALILIASFF